MKKIKLSFLSVALVAIGSSFIPLSSDPCAGQQLYYQDQADGTFKATAKPNSVGCKSTIPNTICKYYQSAPGVFTACDPNIYGRLPFTP